MNEKTYSGDTLEIAQPLQLTIETPTVDKVLLNFEKQWFKTAESCLVRADELESAAEELRQRAKFLMDARSYLADVKTTVQFEIDSRNRSASLLLVKPNGG